MSHDRHSSRVDNSSLNRTFPRRVRRRRCHWPCWSHLTFWTTDNTLLNGLIRIAFRMGYNDGGVLTQPSNITLARFQWIQTIFTSLMREKNLNRASLVEDDLRHICRVYSIRIERALMVVRRRSARPPGSFVSKQSVVPTKSPTSLNENWRESLSCFDCIGRDHKARVLTSCTGRHLQG